MHDYDGRLHILVGLVLESCTHYPLMIKGMEKNVKYVELLNVYKCCNWYELVSVAGLRGPNQSW